MIDITKIAFDLDVIRKTRAGFQSVHSFIAQVGIVCRAWPEVTGVRMNFKVVTMTKEVSRAHRRKWGNDVGHRFARRVALVAVTRNS